MPKSVFGGAHRHLVDTLVAARQRSGLTQREVAAKLGKDQSFISIIEGGQRRVDVIEFFAIARALNANPVQLIQEIEAALPRDIEI